MNINRLWISIRVVSFALGFPGALFFVLSEISAFNWYFFRAFGILFQTGPLLPFMWFLLCLAVFVCTTWLTKPASRHFYHRMDYSVILLVATIGFVLAAYTTWHAPTSLNLILMPVAAYSLAMIALGELVIRLRDKNLLKTLYWIGFFRVYHPWKPMGLFALGLLVIHFILLGVHFLEVMRFFGIFGICALTYFAAYLLNLATEYDKANVDKIKAERFKSELITNVSHDIKTPLTSIINYVDLLKTEPLEGQAAEYLQVLDRKSNRLKVLIEDLMEASKAGTGNMRMDMQEISLVELVGQVAGEFEDNFADKDLTLVMRRLDIPIFIIADSRHLYRALENLFSNAAKYALGGTRVFVEISETEDKTMLTLQNTAEEPIDLTGDDLAGQFIRGDKARQTEGSGLGLYIAKSLIELMGGEFHVNVIGDLFRVDILLKTVNS